MLHIEFKINQTPSASGVEVSRLLKTTKNLVRIRLGPIFFKLEVFCFFDYSPSVYFFGLVSEAPLVEVNELKYFCGIKMFFIFFAPSLSALTYYVCVNCDRD